MSKAEKPLTGSAHPWHKRPRWQKRIHGWLCYQATSWVSLFCPELSDRAMYMTLRDQFEDRTKEETK